MKKGQINWEYKEETRFQNTVKHVKNPFNISEAVL